jgi:hypothetical protein
MKKNIAPKARKENLVVQELGGEVLIYDLDTNKAFCLNEASALVWQACDGNKDVSEIRSLLGKQLNSTVNDDFVWLALDQLKKENLIENKDEVAVDFNGMSRRDVIKKVGLASVIALPVVASLVAPKAAMAASTCGQPCSGGTNGCGAGNTCPDCAGTANNKVCIAR